MSESRVSQKRRQNRSTTGEPTCSEPHVGLDQSTAREKRLHFCCQTLEESRVLGALFTSVVQQGEPRNKMGSSNNHQAAMPFMLSHLNNRHSSDRCPCDFVPAHRVQNRPITSWRSSRKRHLGRSSAAVKETRRRRRNGTAAAMTHNPKAQKHRLPTD